MVKFAKSPVSQQRADVERCHRCGGLMVPERVFELGSFDWRCVSCGERVDPVILAHRQSLGSQPKDSAREQAEKLFVGHGKPRLN
jgi:hypothetical protein